MFTMQMAFSIIRQSNYHNDRLKMIGEWLDKVLQLYGCTGDIKTWPAQEGCLKQRSQMSDMSFPRHFSPKTIVLATTRVDISLWWVHWLWL